MIKKASYLVAGALLGATAVAGLSQAPLLTGANAATTDTYKQLNLFSDVFDRIRADYVEQPDDAALIKAAIDGMLASLDPHSNYLDPKAFQDMQVQTSGQFGGLGIEVTMEDGNVKV